jgi:uncharacterized protein (TIGR02001 family)
MKRTMLLGIVGLFLLFGSIAPAFAADVTATMDMESAYVWRGLTLNDGAVLQPSMDVASGGFDFNVWGNFDIAKNDFTRERNRFSEVDLTMSYAYTLDPVTITVGGIEYLFPNTDAEGTREVFLGISGSPLEGVSVGVTGYYDCQLFHDYYVSANLGYDYTFSNKLDIGAGASCGVIGKDEATMVNGGTQAGFNDYTLSLTASYPVVRAMQVGAYVAYTNTFNRNVLPVQEVDFHGGANISYKF